MILPYLKMDKFAELRSLTELMKKNWWEFVLTPSQCLELLTLEQALRFKELANEEVTLAGFGGMGGVYALAVDDRFLCHTIANSMISLHGKEQPKELLPTSLTTKRAELTDDCSTQAIQSDIKSPVRRHSIVPKRTDQ